MTLKMKALIVAYIFSILLFSGFSRAAHASFHNDTSSPASKVNFSIVKGKVFELNGHLYFESDSNETLLVHPDNFSFFRNQKLPTDVQAEAKITNHQNGYSGTLRTVQFFIITLQKGAVL